MKGTSFAILGSVSITISALIIEVETNHQNVELSRYLITDFEWF
jgi:hypothetical protein